VIEIPFGSSVKYELDKISGLIQTIVCLLRGLLSSQLWIHSSDSGEDETRSMCSSCQETVVPLTIIHAARSA